MARPPHRPTLYKQSYDKDVVEWLSSGKTLVSFAEHVGVHVVSLWDWKERNESFALAIKKGREIANNLYAEQFLLDAIRDESIQSVPFVMYCRNVLKLKTRDEPDNSATEKLTEALKSSVITYALPDNGRLKSNDDKTTT